MKLLDNKIYKKEFYLISGVSNGLLIGGTLMLTVVLFNLGVGEAVITKNMSTSIVSSEAIMQGSQAAPWALISLNWFLCKLGVKKWRDFLKKHL